MADDTLEIRVNTAADTAALESAKDQLEALGDAAGQAGEAATGAAEGVGELTESGGTATSALNQNARAVQQLIKFLEQLAAEAKNAGGELKETAANARELGETTEQAGMTGRQAMSAVSVATQAAGGNFSGAAMGAGRLLAQLKGIGMTVPQIALVTAAFLSLVKLVQTLAEEARNARRMLDEIAQANFEASINRAKDAYEKWAESINKVNRARDAEARHNAEMADAMKAQEIAALNLAKARELANAQTPEQQRLIVADYAKRVSDTSARHDARAERQRVADSEAKAAGMEKESEAIKIRMREISESLAAITNNTVTRNDMISQGGRANNLANFGAFGEWLGSLAGGVNADHLNSLTDKEQGFGQKLFEEFKRLDAALGKNTEEITAQNRQTEVFRAQASANAMNREADAITTGARRGDAQGAFDSAEAQRAGRHERLADLRAKNEADSAAFADSNARLGGLQSDLTAAQARRDSMRAANSRRGASSGVATQLAERNAEAELAKIQSAFNAERDLNRRLAAAFEENSKARAREMDNLARKIEADSRRIRDVETSTPPGN